MRGIIEFLRHPFGTVAVESLGLSSSVKPGFENTKRMSTSPGRADPEMRNGQTTDSGSQVLRSLPADGGELESTIEGDATDPLDRQSKDLSENRIALRVTGATDLRAALRELRQVFTLPLATAHAAIKEHNPIPLTLRWPTYLSPPWMMRDRILDHLGPHLSDLTTMLDRLGAVGATAQILIGDEPFDRDGLIRAMAQKGADSLAKKFREGPDSYEFRMQLLRIADRTEPATEVERELALKELAFRLRDVDARELVWTADSIHLPELVRNQLCRNLALLELARRGTHLTSLRSAAGPCPHPRWRPGLDDHFCECCSVMERHDYKLLSTARGWDKKCFICGNVEPD